MAPMFGVSEHHDKKCIIVLIIYILATVTTISTKLQIRPRNVPSRDRVRKRHENLYRLTCESDSVCISELRMTCHGFKSFCDLIKSHGLLQPTRVSVEEQVSSFLLILGHSFRMRNVLAKFYRSTQTIYKNFYSVLRAVLRLYPELVKLPGEAIPDEIMCNPTWYRYFKDAVGAIDGTHVPAMVPIEWQIRFRNRHGNISQNVMCAVSFDLKFQYVLSGWEGSAADARVLNDALSRDGPLVIPSGKYYLVDGGYATMPGFLSPYRGAAYWLNDTRGRNARNHKELFNQIHSSIRNVVERATYFANNDNAAHLFLCMDE